MRFARTIRFRPAHHPNPSATPLAGGHNGPGIPVHRQSDTQRQSAIIDLISFFGSFFSAFRAFGLTSTLYTKILPGFIPGNRLLRFSNPVVFLKIFKVLDQFFNFLKIFNRQYHMCCMTSRVRKNLARRINWFCFRIAHCLHYTILPGFFAHPSFRLAAPS